MKLLRRLSVIASSAAAVAAMGVVVLGGGGVASAGTAAHLAQHSGSAPLLAGHHAGSGPQGDPDWYDAADGDYLYEPSVDFITSGTHMTSLGAATGCNGSGFCEHKLGNGNCLEWDSADNTVSASACTGVDRQLWYLDSYNGAWLWINYYADLLFRQDDYCLQNGTYWTPLLTATGANNKVISKCPLGGGYGAPDPDQVWAATGP